jgi:hypothetical protein
MYSPSAESTLHMVVRRDASVEDLSGLVKEANQPVLAAPLLDDQGRNAHGALLLPW